MKSAGTIQPSIAGPTMSPSRISNTTMGIANQRLTARTSRGAATAIAGKSTIVLIIEMSMPTPPPARAPRPLVMLTERRPRLAVWGGCPGLARFVDETCRRYRRGMRDLQARIIAELNVSPVIDPATQVRARVDFLKDYLRTAGARGFVLGVSGGQDYHLAGRLCRTATEELVADGVPARFVAVRLPYGAQHDEEDAQLALEFIDPQETVVFNIKRGVDGLTDGFADATGSVLSDFGKGNVKARMRMVAQYALAGEGALLVVGTDHAAEAVTGFFTKYGDGGADILPLSGLTKRQGRADARASRRAGTILREGAHRRSPRRKPGSVR